MSKFSNDWGFLTTCHLCEESFNNETRRFEKHEIVAGKIITTDLEYCEGCIECHTVECDCCGEIIHEDDELAKQNQTDTDGTFYKTLCKTCYEELDIATEINNRLQLTA